jgi:hypothetical protein
MSTENKPKDVNRRDFLQKTTAAAIGSFFIVPRHVLGKGYRAPAISLISPVSAWVVKGFSDTNNAWNKGAENLVALCDVDWGRRR